VTSYRRSSCAVNDEKIDSGAPFCRASILSRGQRADAAQAVERPVDQSLQKVDAFTRQQTQLLAQQQNQPAQEESVRAQRIV
jgi:hypothetical protein